MKSSKLSLIFLATAFVAACGGGGGDDSGVSAPINRYSNVGTFPITACVKDNVTGLTWEGKSNSASSYKGFSNYDNVNIIQISYIGSGSKYNQVYYKPTQQQIDADTNSIGYRNSVNAMALCGYTDWRMPTFEELQMLATNIDDSWFPNIVHWKYWTSSGVAHEHPLNLENSYDAKFVVFNSKIPSYVEWETRFVRNGVRLVR